VHRVTRLQFLLGSAPTFPTDRHPIVAFVKINMSSQHQQPGRYQFLTRRTPLANQDPAMVPAHSVLMSSRP
jgi:hypothetical protein